MYRYKKPDKGSKIRPNGGEMKKFLLFPVVCLLICGAVIDARAACEFRELGLFDIKNSNEYLYQNPSDYNANYTLECGGGYCPSQQKVFMNANHYHDGKKIPTAKIYTCVASGDTRWSEYNVMDLAECTKVVCKIDNVLYNIDGWYIMDARDGTSGVATGRKNQLLVQSETDLCRCKNPTNSSNPEPVKPSPVKQEPVKPVQPTNPGTKTSCVQQRCGGLTGSQKSECVTCCYVPASLAKWENGVCKCQQNPNQKFNPATLQCEDVANVAPQPVAPQYDCDATKLAQVAKWKVTYGSNLEVSTLINIILDYCNGATRVESVFNAYYVELQALIDSLQKSEAEAAAAAKITAQINASKTKISAAVEEMDTISAGFDDSVWKTAEGKFNTSRLVSDSVAGVVLGTAGGLITSNVVKKNQVENGFEDIQCTVGGQVVAGWGDQFRVGIQ